MISARTSGVNRHAAILNSRPLARAMKCQEAWCTMSNKTDEYDFGCKTPMRTLSAIQKQFARICEPCGVRKSYLRFAFRSTLTLELFGEYQG